MNKYKIFDKHFPEMKLDILKLCHSINIIYRGSCDDYYGPQSEKRYYQNAKEVLLAYLQTWENTVGYHDDLKVDFDKAVKDIIFTTLQMTIKLLEKE